MGRKNHHHLQSVFNHFYQFSWPLAARKASRLRQTLSATGLEICNSLTRANRRTLKVACEGAPGICTGIIQDGHHNPNVYRQGSGLKCVPFIYEIVNRTTGHTGLALLPSILYAHIPCSFSSTWMFPKYSDLTVARKSQHWQAWTVLH